MEMQTEMDPAKLWIPEGSDFIKNLQSIMDTVGEGYQPQFVLIVSDDNVLNPTVMKKLYVIDETVKNITFTSKNNSTVKYDDICLK